MNTVRGRLVAPGGRYAMRKCPTWQRLLHTVHVDRLVMSHPQPVQGQRRNSRSRRKDAHVRRDFEHYSAHQHMAATRLSDCDPLLMVGLESLCELKHSDRLFGLSAPSLTTARLARLGATVLMGVRYRPWRVADLLHAGGRLAFSCNVHGMNVQHIITSTRLHDSSQYSSCA